MGLFGEPKREQKKVESDHLEAFNIRLAEHEARSRLLYKNAARSKEEFERRIANAEVMQIANDLIGNQFSVGALYSDTSWLREVKPRQTWCNTIAICYY